MSLISELDITEVAEMMPQMLRSMWQDLNAGGMSAAQPVEATLNRNYPR
jgi:hypothetical protein